MPCPMPRAWPATDEQTVAELVRPDSEALSELENVKVTLMPYRLRRRDGLRPMPSNGTETAATRSSGWRTSP
jgi:hypothetical protein